MSAWDRGDAPTAREREQLMAEREAERDDIASGEVWPDPPAWCEECRVEGHGWATCPRNPERARADWVAELEAEQFDRLVADIFGDPDDQ